MTLGEFIKKRLEELGKNKTWLVNSNDLDWTTLSNINQGKSISKVTQEKLAKALGCSQGDIQACLAEQNPLKKVPVKKAAIVQDILPEKEPEEKPFPVYHSVYEEDKREGEERYKQKLRDMCLRIFASGVPGVHTMEKIYADIGYALVKELANRDED